MTTKLNYTDGLVKAANRLNRSFTKLYADSLRSIALTPTEADALRLLKQSGCKESPSLKRIAEMSNIDTPPSRMMKSLRDRDLVVQERDQNDERVYRFKLSRKGQSVAEKVNKCRDEALEILGANTNSDAMAKAVRAVEALGLDS